MDNIIIEGIKCQAHIGVPPQERSSRQSISIDLEVQADLYDAVQKDDFRLTIDYEELVRLTRATVETGDHSLVETLADKICTAILTNFPVQTVKVRLRKFPKSLKDQVASVGVLFIRTRNG